MSNSVHRQRRMGEMTLQDAVDHRPCGMKLGRIQGVLREVRGISRRRQDHIAIPQRYRQGVSQLHDHLAAGLRAAVLQEAQVTLRYPGLDREPELAETAALSSLPQEGADAVVMLGHTSSLHEQEASGS